MYRPLAVLAIMAALATPFAAAPAMAQGEPLIIEVKPRSWLDAGREVRVGYGRDYATSAAFGGGPVNGISSRGTENLPRGTGPLITFPFLGANLNR